MQDNDNNQNEQPVATVVSAPVPIVTQPQNTLMKDLMIPLSIVIAGVFIGGGLYFGGPAAPAVPSGNPLLDLAVNAEVDGDDFLACLEAGETLPEVQEDMDNGIATGGRGTPWGIVIGPTGKKYPLNGALPQQAIEQLIELAKTDTTPADESEETINLNKVSPVTEDDHIKGDIDAAVMIVEYSDYDCPFCTRFHSTMNNIVVKYDSSEVAWVYRHFPLEQLHPQAKTVAVASECVAKLEGNAAFWSFSDGYLSE